MLLNKTLSFLVPSTLKPNEEILPDRVAWLSKKIQTEQLWRVPITVDSRSMSIMDGHHRYTVAMQLGLAKVPCLLLSYEEVEFWSTHPNIQLTPHMVVEYANKGIRLPPKSTRHQFKTPLPDCNVSLKLLFD
ncbi:ParB N-terminal domain-containing protein [Shewanella denitrificans]|jgi:ParB-like chromosome segregation protein Spo0J|uniref:ParB N-terminal domain-containing protein n=1 Tax=Shewanella denitrificans TaxID=192073 RepID=UPI000674FAB9|nr:ParB N-terminal domain-containing protein [Shewanella denitrificans]